MIDVDADPDAASDQHRDRRPAGPPSPSEPPGRLVAIDRARRATAALLVLWFARELAEACLGRGPDVAANQIVSWGGVTATQVGALVELCEDDDATQRWGELVAGRAGRDLVFAVVWPVET